MNYAICYKLQTLVIRPYKQSKNTTQDNDKDIISKHFCVVSTNLDLTEKFGIDSNNVFGIWFIT